MIDELNVYRQIGSQLKVLEKYNITTQIQDVEQDTSYKFIHEL